MTSTLTPTCSLCGLRFQNGPLLELHLREDHPRHSAPAEPGHGAPRTKTGTPATGPRPRRPRAGRAMTAPRRVAGAFRHVNAELLLASEAMLRLPGVPRRLADPSPGRMLARRPPAAGPSAPPDRLPGRSRPDCHARRTVRRA